MFRQELKLLVIDENMIQKAARQTKGAGGPSQLDADQYHHILLSSKYKKEGKELREEISKLAKKLASNLDVNKPVSNNEHR